MKGKVTYCSRELIAGLARFTRLFPKGDVSVVDKALGDLQDYFPKVTFQ
jgi:hypothetical protein